MPYGTCFRRLLFGFDFVMAFESNVKWMVVPTVTTRVHFVLYDDRGFLSSLLRLIIITQFVFSVKSPCFFIIAIENLISQLDLTSSLKIVETMLTL